MDVAYGAAEEAGAEALEFFDGVGGEAAEARIGWSLSVVPRGLARPLMRRAAVVGGGFGGVDDLHAGRDGSFDERAQERVVGASEDERVGLEAGGCGVGC